MGQLTKQRVTQPSPNAATMADPDRTRRLDQPATPIHPALENETSDDEISEGNNRCSYCKLLRLKDCNVHQTTPPARCAKCIQRDYPCTSAHPTGEYGRKHRLPGENRPPHADNLCEQRIPWAPISKMRIIEGRCELSKADASFHFKFGRELTLRRNLGTFSTGNA
jgi:hypothetical protein